MEKIVNQKAINLIHLNNDEFAEFINGVVNLVETATPEKLFIKNDTLQLFKSKLSILTDATRQTRASKETEEIVSLDKQRNDLIVYILNTIKLEQKNPISEKRELAIFLYKEFRNYHGIQSLPIRQKSHAVSSLIVDLEKDIYKEKLANLGLSESISVLLKTNQDIQKLMEGRAENQLANTLPNVSKLRKEIQALYKYITKCAFAMNITNNSTQSTNFVNLLNKLVEDTILANKHRLSKISISSKKKM